MSKLFVDKDGKTDWKKIGHRARSAFAVLLSLAIIVGGGLFAYNKLHSMYMDWRTSEDYIGEGKDRVEVVIPAGVSLTDIGTILIDAKVIRSMKGFRSAVGAESKAKNIQAGKFALKTELPAKTAIAMLLDPKNRVANQMTIIEGLRVERQWAAISKAEGIKVEDMAAAAKDPASWKLPAWANGNPEGFLFPDTYELTDKPTPAEILTRQTQQFSAVTHDLRFEERAAELGLTPLQLLTVASLVQAEVGKKEYMPKVARVIYNRLAAKMPLQFDSTVHFAVNKYDSVLTTQEQRATDSPYNTYLTKNAGQLPPGPINSPGKAAMEAAMNPEDNGLLYFVTVNPETGETLFASTNDEHNANTAKLQAWCKAHAGKC